MKRYLLAAVLVALPTAALAQYQGQYSANPYTSNRVNTYKSGGSLYSNDGQFRGNLNSNQYDPDSVSNPYGKYGSQYSSDSVNNPYGTYGSPYSSQSPNNPYGNGMRVCGVRGCD